MFLVSISIDANITIIDSYRTTALLGVSLCFLQASDFVKLVKCNRIQNGNATIFHNAVCERVCSLRSESEMVRVVVVFMDLINHTSNDLVYTCQLKHLLV